jgi:hypothetical protein
MGQNLVDCNITSSFPLNMKMYFQHKNQTIKLGFKKTKLREKIIIVYYAGQLKSTLQRIYGKKEQLCMVLVFI